MNLYLADCLDILPTLKNIDTIITDPPYGLKFMGKDWDNGVPGAHFWELALEACKPGAFLFAFGGTRTHHRLMCAIEDAGWIIRDVVCWLYGTGFPKSHDISKAIDKVAGAEREVVGEYQWPDGKPRHTKQHTTQRAGIYSDIKTDGSANDRSITASATPDAQTWDGWGTALKPAWEPIIVAMKPLDSTFAHNALTHGVAGLWIDGGRVGTETRFNPPTHKDTTSAMGSFAMCDGRGSTVSGRWPANLVLDEQAGAMLDAQSGVQCGGKWGKQGKEGAVGLFGVAARAATSEPYIGDTGGASRFFYCAKASKKERTANHTINNTHPTVKPISLMRYLCRLSKTPTGGTVLDMFMGSGSTGVAAILEDREFIGIEKDADSYKIAQHRIKCAAETMHQASF